MAGINIIKLQILFQSFYMFYQHRRVAPFVVIDTKKNFDQVAVYDFGKTKVNDGTERPADDIG